MQLKRTSMHNVWYDMTRGVIFSKILRFLVVLKVFWNWPTPIFLVLNKNDQILKPIFSVFEKTTHLGWVFVKKLYYFSGVAY